MFDYAAKPLYTLFISLCKSWRHVRWSQFNWLHILLPYIFVGSSEEYIFKLHICYTILMAYDSTLVIALYAVIE